MNNNENQNLNNVGMNQGGYGPNPMPTPQNPMPQPEALQPVGNNLGAQSMGQMVPPATPMENLGSFEQNISPAPIGNNMNGPVAQPSIEQPAPQPMNQMNPVNLAPEGIIAPEPVSQPVQPSGVEPLVSSTLTENTVLNQGPTATPNPMNGGVSPMPNQGMPQAPNMGGMPPINNIGMMGGVPTPPVLPNEPEKEKKKMNKTVLFLLIVVLIAAVGFGVYYFLFLGKSKTPAVVVTTIMPEELEAGKELIVDSPATYVSVTGMNISDCTVNSNLNPKKVGSYEYTITCGTKVVGPNKVTVKDTVPPVVTTRDLYIIPGDNIYPDDFIESVEDVSECTYEFESNIDEMDLNAAGEHEIQIKVIDAYENEVTVTSKLIIDENAPQEYLYCEGVGTSSIQNAKIYQTYKYGISGTGNIYNMLKIVTYKFETLEDYEVSEANIENDAFDGLTGIIDKNAESLTITVTQKTDEETLSTEFNLTPFPKTSLEIEDYHIGKDEMCYTDVE